MKMHRRLILPLRRIKIVILMTRIQPQKSNTREQHDK